MTKQTQKTQTFTIRKDAFHGVSKQWCCDAETSDGKVLKNWCYGFRTRGALVAHINAVSDGPCILKTGEGK